MRVETFTVTQRGVGKPDYTREIFAGRERAGLELKYNQRLKVFGTAWHIGEPLYPLIPVNSLAVGDRSRLLDLEGNIATPYTIPVGYTLSLFAAAVTVTQDIMLYAYIDSVSYDCLATPSGGVLSYFDKIIGIGTAIIDPDAEDEHEIDLIVRNVGVDVMYGGLQMVGILERVGSADWPKTKDCRCPYCDHIQNVPVATSRIVCDTCSKTYIVYNLSKFKGAV